MGTENSPFRPDEMVQDRGSNRGNLTKEAAGIDADALRKDAKGHPVIRVAKEPSDQDLRAADERLGDKSVEDEIRQRATDFAASQKVGVSPAGQKQYAEDQVQGFRQARKEETAGRIRSEQKKLEKKE